MENKRLQGLVATFAVVSAVLVGTQLEDLTARVSLREQIPMRGAPVHLRRHEYHRRYTEARQRSQINRSIRSYRTQNRVPRFTPVAEPVEAPTETCVDLGALKGRVLGVIPATRNQYYNRLHRLVSMAFDEQLADAECLTLPEKAEAEVSTPAENRMQEVKYRNLYKRAPRVNNNCEQYGYLTRRYKQCIVNERERQRYNGRYYGGYQR